MNFLISSAHAYIVRCHFFQMKIILNVKMLHTHKNSSNSEKGNETKLTVNSASLKQPLKICRKAPF